MLCSLERPPAMSAILRRFVIRRPSVADAAILSYGSVVLSAKPGA
jgi:hypothetical protein